MPLYKAPTTAASLGLGTSDSPGFTGLSISGNAALGDGSGDAHTIRGSFTMPDQLARWTGGIYGWGSSYAQGVLSWDTGKARVYAGTGNSLNLGAGDRDNDIIIDGSTGRTALRALTDAANDAAAESAGVAVNQLYRNGSVVMIRVS